MEVWHNMTQIKLRRDTSANFTSKNPVLGLGEPAYEIDTKKLKIGDGTTAYTQLEYFSAGGGGSTNISATLPLKIVDGVISLEVDGQTIQVVDGKLHANLDELGNKVNSLTGEVTDLSGRVTTVEGEVAKKEDEITALEPITLEKKVISNLNGMLYTSDGTSLYAQSITQLELEGNWFGPHITYNNPVSYIDIPLDINKDQVITIPRFSTSYSYSEATTFMLGSYDANGLFYPIFFQAKGNSSNGSCWLISNNYPEAVGTTYLSGIDTRGSYFGALNVSSDKVYIQAKYDESSGFYIRTFGAYPDNSSSEGLQIVYTNPADIERLRQITACRFINMGKMNTPSTATSATLFGRYDGAHLESGTLPDLTNIPNSFSLTDVQSLNYIQLNLGDGLSVVDGKLTASSTAPANMVTTDTAQTITGQKEFSHTILSLNQDLIRGQQSTSYRNGAGLSMGSNSTSTDGGVFAPQWRIYSTTGNVDRTETIMTTYNQSKLNDSNFNTANKLVRLDSSGKLPAIDGSQLTNLPSGGGLEVKKASSANFNSAELLETGLYYISGAKAPQNGPVPYAVSAMLITMKRYVESNNQNIQQTWIGCEDLVGNQIYTRYSKSNGVMNAWTRVDSNKIASASALGSIKVGNGLTISSDGTLSATGGSSEPPANMVTTDTSQTITGDKTFTGGNTFQEHITIGNTGTGQIDKLKLAALNGSSTATTLYNGLQIYTDIDTYTSTLRVGDVNLPMILQGSTISDNNNNLFLKTKSLTQSEYDALTTKDSSVLYVITD